MLKRKIVVALLGGGAYLVSSAARAQTLVPSPVPSDQVPEPTPETVLLCDYYFVPANQFPSCEGGCCDLLSWPPGPSGTMGNSSWGMANPAWARDRRPAVMIQFASAGWRLNPRSLADWWWITPNSPASLDADVAVDEKSPNPDMNSNIELVPGYNSIPDQFDVLMRRIMRAHAQGIRRIIFHEPAGVQGVQQVGWSGYRGGQRYAIYGGTDHSMNQFLTMPDWKKKYFRSDPANPVYAGTRLMTFTWDTFVSTYCTTNPDLEPDKMSIEVYIGGGIGTRTCQLNTMPTIPNPGPAEWYVPHRVSSFKQWHPNLPNVPVYEELWSEPHNSADFPKPIDPRDYYALTSFWSEIKPWTEIGVKTIWLDAAAQNIPSQARRWGTVEVAHSPFLTGQHIRFGGEAFPTLDNAGLVSDDCGLAALRWFTNSQVVMYNYSVPTRTFKPFQLSKISTECHFLENSDLPLRWSEWAEARRRGYVVGLYYGQFGTEIEKLKRWYSIGNIQVADFDGDADVDMEDYNDAYTATHMSNRDPNDPLVFATGDILQNSDNVINEADWNKFLEFWTLRQGDTLTYQFRD